ncbi:hypothetical protein ACFWU5_16580 [Nocardia sp. NPDC058640]|uniref:hypothetical protein n=1 Tax=Nocardia sp. NPDC058640 TaxID=3346571 RepID=UPI0036686418
MKHVWLVTDLRSCRDNPVLVTATKAAAREWVHDRHPTLQFHRPGRFDPDVSALYARTPRKDWVVVFSITKIPFGGAA